MPRIIITSNKTMQIVAAVTNTMLLSFEWLLRGSSPMEEFLGFDILLDVTKGLFSVFLVEVKLVGTNLETVALEAAVLVLKLVFVVILEVDLVI